MNRASHQNLLATLLRGALISALMALAACSYLQPQQPPPKPAKLQKPAVVDTQQKERARQALQKATASSNEYSACVMFSTSTHRGNSGGSASDIAAAACANCAPKLDDYEQGMATYYEESPVKSSTGASAKERAHDRRVELEQTTRDAAVRSLARAN